MSGCCSSRKNLTFEKLKVIFSVLRICECFAQVTIPMKAKNLTKIQQDRVQAHSQGNQLDDKVPSCNT